jgi:hypothetical protein
MVTLDEAARAACVSARTIYRWVEDEKLHFIETAVGGLLICHPPSHSPGLRSRRKLWGKPRCVAAFHRLCREA